MLKKYLEEGSYRAEDMWPYGVEGIGSDFVPRNVDKTYIDTVLTVDDKRAAHMARRLHREEGLFAGWSAGAIVEGAIRYAQAHLQEKDVMVVILPDHGSRYLKKIYNDRWMMTQGYLPRTKDP